MRQSSECTYTMENGVVCVTGPERGCSPEAHEIIREMDAKGVDFVIFPVIVYADGKWNWMLVTEEGRFGGFRCLGDKAADKKQAIEQVKDLYVPGYNHS